MIPAELKPEDFHRYPEQSRAFAIQYLAVLRRLPAAACPSFLQQVRNVATNFPAENASLRALLDGLQAMGASDFAALAEPLRRIELPKALLAQDWVNDPATFVTAMTAHLWSSGQIDRFREGTERFFAAVAEPRSRDSRLLIAVIGQGTQPTPDSFGRLRKYGLLVKNLDESAVGDSLLHAVAQRAEADATPYAHWYVDGGQPLDVPVGNAGITEVSYASLHPLRMEVLAHMKNTIFSGDAGTEAMQASLSSLTMEAVGAQKVSTDPVLQRFYTELFTLSSGPQIFSTSFVQWTGRELMRRAQPKTMLVRYAPRQRHRNFNEMVSQVEAETVLDPEGSLRDAQMGVYYAWIETLRAVPDAAITLLVWVEGGSQLLVIAPTAPAGTETATPLTIASVLKTFS